MTRFSIGSVSSGTLRHEDLIPAFMDALDSLKDDLSLSLPVGASFDETETIKREVTRLDDLLAAIERRQSDDDYYESEEAQWDLDALQDELNNLAPAYTYFGAHEGDGADFGFWPSLDSLEEDCRSGEVLKLSDLSELPEDYSGTACVVNDHGNVSVYSVERGRYTLIWDCV